jgi:hypothetical protein
VIGLGQAGVVALVAAGLLDDRVASAAAVDAPATFVTETAYGKTTRMGLLVPGLLRVGDVPQLAALVAPRKLVISGGTTPTGGHLREKALREAFAFTADTYKLAKAADQLTVAEDMRPDEVVRSL